MMFDIHYEIFEFQIEQLLQKLYINLRRLVKCNISADTFTIVLQDIMLNVVQIQFQHSSTIPSSYLESIELLAFLIESKAKFNVELLYQKKE